MNQIKKDLEKELQSMALSDEKKQSMLRKMDRKKHVNWTYRFVLTAFTLLGLGFSYLLFTGNMGEVNHAALPEIVVEEILFSTEVSKVLLMIGIFIIFYFFMKFSLRRRTLAVCASCSEEWSFGESLKASMKGNEIKCPYCHVKQVKTKETIWEMIMLQWLFPLGILFSQFFDNPIRGFLIYAACTMVIVMRFSPYLMSFQGGEEDTSNHLAKDDSGKYKIWKFVKVIAPPFLTMVIIWGIWEKSETYPEPQEGLQELMFADTTLIPGYVFEHQALYFSITDNKLLGAHYVDKNIFGWKIEGATSYPINYRDIHTNNYGTVSGKKYLVYGLMEGNDDWIVQVGGEDAKVLNLEMVEEIRDSDSDLKGLYLWYFEREGKIDVLTDEIQLVDKKTGEVLEVLTFD